jgi:hypothetical protein
MTITKRNGMEWNQSINPPTMMKERFLQIDFVTGATYIAIKQIRTYLIENFKKTKRSHGVREAREHFLLL